MTPEEIERAEALISVIDQCQTQDKRWAIVVGFMQAERREENEACARTAENLKPHRSCSCFMEIAAAIRARMETK